MRKFFLSFFCVVFCIGVCAENITSIESLLRPAFTDPLMGSNMQTVDKIYVINLDRCADRRAYMSNLLGEIGLLFERCQAFDGWQIDKKIRRKVYRVCTVPWEGRLAISRGQIGVLLSHLSVIEDAYVNDYDSIWILEDDVEFLVDPSEVDECIQSLDLVDPEWEIFYTDTGSRYKRPDGVVEYYSFEQNFGGKFDLSLITSPKFKKFKNEKFHRIQHRLGAYSMILSRRGIEKIREYFQLNKMKYAYDVDLNFYLDKRMYQSNIDLVTTSGVFGSSTTNDF